MNRAEHPALARSTPRPSELAIRRTGTDVAASPTAMHASFNASGQLGVTGEWQPIASLALVAGFAPAPDRRNAASWLAAGAGAA